MSMGIVIGAALVLAGVGAWLWLLWRDTESLAVEAAERIKQDK